MRPPTNLRTLKGCFTDLPVSARCVCPVCPPAEAVLQTARIGVYIPRGGRCRANPGLRWPHRLRGACRGKGFTAFSGGRKRGRLRVGWQIYMQRIPAGVRQGSPGSTDLTSMDILLMTTSVPRVQEISFVCRNFAWIVTHGEADLLSGYT